MKMFKVDDVMKAFRECKDPKDFMFKIYSEVKLIDAIPVSDNATNGDIIKAMFPNIESRLDEKTGITLVKWADGTTKTFKTSWWNAPYNPTQNMQNADKSGLEYADQPTLRSAT